MITTKLSLGEITVVKADQIYALPYHAVYLTSVGTIQYGLTATGAFANLPNTSLGAYVHGGFIKCSVDTKVVVKRSAGGIIDTVPPSYFESVLVDAPIHYWRLNEQSGAVFLDIIKDLNGSETGGAIIRNEPGALLTEPDTCVKIAESVDFPGWIQCGSITLSGDYSIECWFKTDNVGSPIYVTNRNPTVSGNIFLGLTSNGHRIVFGSNNAGGSVLGDTPPLNDNQWHHLVAIHNATLGRSIYVDGILIGSDSVIMPISTGPVLLGYDNFVGQMGGWLDEVAIYDKVLTPEQVLAHYEAR